MGQGEPQERGEPHPFSVALRDFFADATGHPRSAVLVDLDGDGIDEAVAVKRVIRELGEWEDTGAPWHWELAVFATENGSVVSALERGSNYELYISDTNHFITHAPAGAGYPFAFVYRNGQFEHVTEMQPTTEPGGDEEYYPVDNPAHGIGSVQYLLFDVLDRLGEVTDHTAQILSMTVSPRITDSWYLLLSVTLWTGCEYPPQTIFTSTLRSAAAISRC